MWFRVFGKSATAVGPADLLAHLHGHGLAVRGDFRGDDLGWSAAELRLPGDEAPVCLERYLAQEEGLRDDLNAWAAWLETQEHEPAHRRLMEHVIGTAELITLRKPLTHADEVTLDRLCEEVCRFLAAGTDGVYQADAQGFFAADGSLLLKEY